MNFGSLYCVSKGLSLVKKKKKVTFWLVILVSDDGAWGCVGAGNIWDISVPSSQFCCKLKTVPKIVFKVN